jgi:hypothetical protein
VSAAFVQQNIEQVQARLAAAAARAGRDPSNVTLVAITKTHPLEKVAAAYEAGLRHFGENRVEEAEDKIDAARVGGLADDAVWHMVGHIQSRKTSTVAPLFAWVHSVDRWKIARRLDEALAESDRVLDILLEVNVSGEESKYGFDLSAWPDKGPDGLRQFDALGSAVERIGGLAHLRLRGLMTLAPYTSNPETVRPVFQATRRLRDALAENFPSLPLDHLSMGMSGDYEVAVEEGATLIRVGTAIFGERET